MPRKKKEVEITSGELEGQQHIPLEGEQAVLKTKKKTKVCEDVIMLPKGSSIRTCLDCKNDFAAKTGGYPYKKCPTCRGIYEAVTDSCVSAEATRFQELPKDVVDKLSVILDYSKVFGADLVDGLTVIMRVSNGEITKISPGVAIETLQPHAMNHVTAHQATAPVNGGEVSEHTNQD